MDEWIATKDRMPGEMVSVLIYNDPQEDVFKGYHVAGQWWYGDHYGRWDAPVIEGIITHWVPLPDPPTG